MPVVKTEAVCLRVIPYSETSQVVWLYTRDSGKVHAIAKGALRPRSRFHGAFDLAGRYEILRIPKPPGQLDVLTEAVLLDDHAGVRRDSARFSLACYPLEFITALTPEGLAQPALYDLLCATLAQLADGSADPIATVFSFEARALTLLGYRPRALACARCERDVREPRAYFACRDGGVVCPRCVPRDPLRLVVRRETLEWLERFLDGETAPPPDLPRRELRFVLDRYVQHLAERRLLTLRGVRQVLESAPPARPSGR